MKDEFWPLRPALHPVYARLLCAEMRRRGFTPETILEGTRLDWQRLHEDNSFLSFEAMRRLIEQCLQLSQCPWLGIDVGFQTQASAHGALGAAMIASRNLSDALRLIQRFSALRQHMAVIHFKFDTDFHVELEELVGLGDIREYLLGQLDPRSAGIVRAISLEGETAGAVGKRLGISEGAVRVALHRAMKRMAVHVRRDER